MSQDRVKISVIERCQNLALSKPRVEYLTMIVMSESRSILSVSDRSFLLAEWKAFFIKHTYLRGGKDKKVNC